MAFANLHGSLAPLEGQVEGRTKEVSLVQSIEEQPEAMPQEDDSNSESLVIIPWESDRTLEII